MVAHHQSGEYQAGMNLLMSWAAMQRSPPRDRSSCPPRCIAPLVVLFIVSPVVIENKGAEWARAVPAFEVFSGRSAYPALTWVWLADLEGTF